MYQDWTALSDYFGNVLTNHSIIHKFYTIIK